MAQAQEVFLFSPTQISGCQLWLDAADSSTVIRSGSSISQWTDKSGKNIDLVQTSAGNRPTYESNYTNGLGAVLFTPNQWIQGNINISTYTRFLVYSNAVVNTGAAVMDGAGFLQNGGNATFQDYVGYNDTAKFQTGGAFRLAEAYMPSVGGVTSAMWINGTLQTLTYQIPAGNYPQTYVALGRRGDGIYFTGAVTEVVLYDRQLTTSEMNIMEGYLAWKWGIQGLLPANHPYKTFRPIGSFPVVGIPPTPFRVQTTQPFVPTQISGCVLWLDPADLTTFTLSGANVTQWRDKSSSRYVFTQGTDAARPRSGLNTMNGLNLLTNQGSQFLQVTNWSQNYTSATVFYVIKPTNAFASWDFLGVLMSPQVTGTPYIYIELLALTTPNRYTATFSSYLNGSIGGDLGTASITNTTFLMTGIMSGVAATNSANVNGSPFSAYNFPTGNANFSATASNVTVYAAGYPSNARSGQYGDILMFNRVLSRSEYQQVEGYLAWKWGLTASLPNGHPYKTPPIAPFPVRVTAFNGSVNQWIPTQVSGINAWYDGADPLGTGRLPAFNTALGTWFDKSGNGRNATGGVSPTFVNGGVQFNGTSTFYGVSIPYSLNYSIFLVATNTELNEIYFFGRNAIGGGRWPTFIQGYGTSTRLEWYEANDRATIVDVPISPFIASVDHTQGGRILGYYYGTQTMNIAQTEPYNATAWDTIGRPGAGIAAGWYKGIMKELIFYSNVVTTAQRQQVEGYLAWKWGLVSSLPANHPFRLFPPPP